MSSYCKAMSAQTKHYLIIQKSNLRTHPSLQLSGTIWERSKQTLGSLHGEHNLLKSLRSPHECARIQSNLLQAMNRHLGIIKEGRQLQKLLGAALSLTSGLDSSVHCDVPCCTSPPMVREKWKLTKPYLQNASFHQKGKLAEFISVSMFLYCQANIQYNAPFSYPCINKINSFWLKINQHLG